MIQRLAVATSRSGAAANRCRMMSTLSASPSSSTSFFPKTNTDALLRKSSSSSLEQTKPVAFNKIAFLGAGNMAQAILNPLISTGLQPADQIALYDTNLQTLQHVLDTIHSDIQTADSMDDLVHDADLLVCAIKPQTLTPSLLQQIHDAPHRPPHATLLSVLAGVPLETYLPAGYDKIVRSMPNTPAMIGRGMTVWCATDSLTLTERKRIDTVLSCLGETMYVDDERHVDMSTSISGSGPAYIFYLMESMIDAGVHMGFPRDKATQLVYHTLLGSTLYAMEEGQHPAILRNHVTSPNGTTASALYELENGGFRTAVKDAMWACYRRSLEMGGLESNVGPGRNAPSASLSSVDERLLEQILLEKSNSSRSSNSSEHETNKQQGKRSHEHQQEEHRWAA